ncbi:MAG: Glutamate--tRNA ligase [Acidimicrobiales bacterium]|nr:MAG: glutamate--tRNA ligase [Actinomycetota bacterium]MBV6510503.1 Glutamate--tRNA ligase [Acidimicrobiales bacterium]RIK07146.1 MAG: glutamate--tRNA ligase [Acidobacteriota bacterium]
MPRYHCGYSVGGSATSLSIVLAPRVRFAPAPTGYLHIGGARTALFNWLFARRNGGEMLLRIEDTDVERSRPELVEVIFETLAWLGIDWDGEPVYQSARVDLYQDAIEQLLASGDAYHDEGAVRFRIPDTGATTFRDVIRGEVTFEHDKLEDFVIRRSDGSPMFFVANAVDDSEMGITHVVRGEDLINITPKVILIREALGLTDRPVFAHLPLIVNEQRQKLSKRRDDVSVGDYRARGFLAEAMANYLALLGWGAPDGVEIRPIGEIMEMFRLEDVTKAPAFFDVKKLTHFNGEYIRELSVDEFTKRCEPWLEAGPWGKESFEPALFERIAPLVKERVKRLDEVPDYVDFLFLDEPHFDHETWDKAMLATPHVAEVLDATIACYGKVEWTAHEIHEATNRLVEALREELGVGKKKIQVAIRVAVTGRAVGPPLFEPLELMGRERVIDRLCAARARV